MKLFQRIIGFFSTRRLLRLANLRLHEMLEHSLLNGDNLRYALGMEQEQKQTQLYHFHNIMAALVLQNGGELVISSELMEAASDKLVDFVADDSNNGAMTIRLKPQQEEPAGQESE